MQLIKSNRLPLSGIVDSLQGGRSDNQDDFGYQDTPLGLFLVVCDGMGGGPGGKTASYIVKCAMIQALLGCTPHMPRTRAMQMATSMAQEALKRKMEESPSLVGMGATFVAILISEESAVIAHVGDSRCYIIRGKRMIYRTQDHSLVAELVRRKALTEEQARVSPQSNVISRGMGSMSNNTPEITEIGYKKGDRFVLCTDGAWSSMPHKELLSHFASLHATSIDLNRFTYAVELIGKNSGGHHDNHTTAVLEMDCTSTYVAKKERLKRTVLLSTCSIATIILLLCWFIGCNDKKKNSTAVLITEHNNISTQQNIQIENPKFIETTNNDSYLKSAISHTDQTNNFCNNLVPYDNAIAPADSDNNIAQDVDDSLEQDTVAIVLEVLECMYATTDSILELNSKNNSDIASPKEKKASYISELKAYANNLKEFKMALHKNAHRPINVIIKLCNTKPNKFSDNVVKKIKDNVQKLIKNIDKNN